MLKIIYLKIINFFKNPKFILLNLALMLIGMKILKSLLNNDTVYNFIAFSLVVILIIPIVKDYKKR